MHGDEVTLEKFKKDFSERKEIKLKKKKKKKRLGEKRAKAEMYGVSGYKMFRAGS